MAKQPTSESPTLPLPPPAQISLDHFVEVATSAALRSLQSHLAAGEVAGKPQPDPWRGRIPHIWVGIIATLEEQTIFQHGTGSPSLPQGLQGSPAKR